MNEIVITRESFLGIQICTTITPDNIYKRMTDVYAVTGNPGTSHGRWELPDYEVYPEYKPVKCQDHDDRWHYILLC